jgi:hypothetical protein
MLPYVIATGVGLIGGGVIGAVISATIWAACAWLDLGVIGFIVAWGCIIAGWIVLAKQLSESSESIKAIVRDRGIDRVRMMGQRPDHDVPYTGGDSKPAPLPGDLMSNKPPTSPGSDKPLPDSDPKDHRPLTLADLFKEWTQDYAARKQENEFGQILPGQEGPSDQQAQGLGEQDHGGIER